MTTDIESLSTTCFAGTLISCYHDSYSSCSLLVNEILIGTSTVNDVPFDRHENLIWTWWWNKNKIKCYEASRRHA